MNINIASFKLLNKNDVVKMIKEDELLTEIAMVSSLETADKYRKEFHSDFNIYGFEVYLNILERVKKLLLRGFNDTDLIVRMIRTNSDYLIQ